MTGSATRDILQLLGFEEDWNAMADERPGYTIDLGNIHVEASQVVGRSLRPVFLFTGTARDHRLRKMVEFELPLSCESIEQGVALIVRGIGEAVEPEKPTPWYALGRKWRDRLPADLKSPQSSNG
ncbi:hypothetical protein EJC49_01100 [Aquibium carbonis]|uniref:Uncharacterized protein n=1 Tax=Aquibium carbonis TaxID=2495581 RepID=A0A3R9YB60_9HYPH|nr:hypothetical protein [Aquibium carbonis]RST88326.1 hypothetical protein EJC49_01100 [Aquibium carbonis]